MKITFDPAKRQTTLEGRGLDMALAREVFSGPTLTVPSDRQGENRFFTLGYLNSRMVVIVWTPRDGGRRIISMRKANESEQKLYGPRLGRP
ncbi:MAG: BrnT family toxin [Roseiarcus sp.]|uniref:BrnT family toxin n=1 Tax=Roseiarcus sp. TaxID=1969460 RepID=UPI003C584B50